MKLSILTVLILGFFSFVFAQEIIAPNLEKTFLITTVDNYYQMKSDKDEYLGPKCANNEYILETHDSNNHNFADYDFEDMKSCKYFERLLDLLKNTITKTTPLKITVDNATSKIVRIVFPM